MSARVEKAPFGPPCDGMQATLFTLHGPNLMKVSVTDYGATLTHLWLPDKSGELADCVLGFDDLAGYRGKDNPYFGATIGRVANRIAKGKFTLDGNEYTLAQNNGPNHLHGGLRGFDKVIWDAVVIDVIGQPPAVKFTYVSADGEEGYPGTCTTMVTYTLMQSGELKIDMESSVDKPCPVNLANHSYFNLGGHGSGNILRTRLHINADRYTPTDADSVPTAELAVVDGTAFDFRAIGEAAHSIGERIGELKSLPGCGGGYDHNYVLNAAGWGRLSLAAVAEDPQSGRCMELYCTAPGVQLYTGNYLGPSKEGAGEDAQPVSGKGGAMYSLNQAFCLETQHFPDSVNQAAFPPVILQPGELYTHRMLFRFQAK
eukprot:TRINITY_DN70802_c0_g1_i1.p1 TRINITY_DN70802_c0_g1~~TRINITY_DN70802_c0_g1_i1.p1  ORF type:complete len:372 (-),score=50.64 TRINITY_DN70802_c0_g1_i1:24-1139(-)